MYWYRRPKEEFNPKKRLGRIHVYTGDGKGKTTAALGVALRAAGQDFRVLIIQFCKGHKDYGELRAIMKYLPNVQLVQYGTVESNNFDSPSDMDKYIASQGFAYAHRAMQTERPDVLILDEINPVLHFGLLPLQEFLTFLSNKHQHTEVILTGRHAPSALLNAADIVTVMTASKRIHDKVFVPRFGIDH